MLSILNRKRLAKASVGCAGAFGILLLFLFCWATYGPDKHELTKHARNEWGREFRKIGLDEVPKHAKYAGGASGYGPYGHWSFRADIPTVRQWLSTSQSLRTAEVKTKSGKKAYLFYAPVARRACLVTVFFAPITNPPISDREALVRVDTVEVEAASDAEHALEDLAHRI